MEPNPTYYKSHAFVYTSKGNKISKRVTLVATGQLVIEGNAVI